MNKVLWRRWNYFCPQWNWYKVPQYIVW